MVMRITCAAVFVSAMVIASPARGQTTQPISPVPAARAPGGSSDSASTSIAKSLQNSSAPAAWVRLVSDLSDALSGAADDGSETAALASLLGDETRIEQFGSEMPEPRDRLARQAAGTTIVSVRAYTWPAEGIASDLSSDIANCEALPADLGTQFATGDEADARRANLTAQQWVSNTLQPSPGQVVAVIVLWDSSPPINAMSLSANGPSARPDAYRPPLFVLVKGARVSGDQDGGFKVTQISYGDTRKALN